MGDAGKGEEEGDRVGGVEWGWVESEVARCGWLWIRTDDQFDSASLATGVRLESVPSGADERDSAEKGVAGQLAEDGQLRVERETADLHRAGSGGRMNTWAELRQRCHCRAQRKILSGMPRGGLRVSRCLGPNPWNVQANWESCGSCLI